MKRLWIWVALALLLSGCGRSAFFTFTGSATYADALPHTQRGEIADRFESKALLTASYLNAIYPQDARYQDGEYFFVGLYIDKDFQGEKAGINNPLYNLTLNGQPYESALKVEENDELLKLMPLVNRWSRYYIVRFKTQPSHELSLKLTHPDTNRQAALTFAKALQD
ncbi:MAG: hypothetical protein AB7E49_02095 [Campylobacterales bacterium]